MNKDLHDIDNLFRSSLESYEENSFLPYVKERLEAALDKGMRNHIKEIPGMETGGDPFVCVAAGFHNI